MANLVIIETRTNGSIAEYALDKTSSIAVETGASYRIIDKDTGREPDSVRLKQDANDLVIEVDGSVVARVEGFYGETIAARFVYEGQSVASSAASGGAYGDVVWESGAGAEAGGSALGFGGGSELWVAGVIGVGAFALAANDDDDGSQTIIPQVSDVDDEVSSEVVIEPFAGPFIATMGVEVYDQEGNLLLETTHNFRNGEFTARIRGDYEGPILINVIDINGDDPDYIDESTGEEVSLGTETLRAMTEIGARGRVEVSVTPLTELAVQLAGVTGNAVSAANLAANAQIAALFGLDDILGQVTTVLDNRFDGTELDQAEQYGAVLAALSGMDNVTGSAQATLSAILGGLTTNADGSLSLSNAAADLIAQGAQHFETNSQVAGVLDLLASLPVGVKDTTPPTTTIDAVVIGVDTGIDGDLITNETDQTITVTLSAPLVAGEKVVISINGGDFIEADSVDGTTATFTDTLSSGSNPLIVKVVDAAGNSGPTTQETVQVDLAAPEVVSVAVNASGEIEITYDEDISASTVDASAFTVTVNGEAYTLGSASVSGTVLTLGAPLTGLSAGTPKTDYIFPDDLVTSLAYNGSTVIDLAGNSAGTGTLAASLTNNSIGVEEVISIANDELNKDEGEFHEVAQRGGAGNDALTVSVDAGQSYASYYAISQVGMSGDDALAVAIVSSQSTFADFGFSYNNIQQSGGTGSDSLTVQMAFNGGSADIDKIFTEGGGIADNEIEQYGGSGNDALSFEVDVNIAPTDFTANDDIFGLPIESNIIFMGGSSGADLLSISINADLDGGLGEADFASYDMQAYLAGGVGDDTLAVGVAVDITGNTAEFDITDAHLLLDGGTGDDVVDVKFAANATVTSDASIEISDQMIDIIGGAGSDTVAVSIDANVSGAPSGANIDIDSSEILVEGGAGDDAVSISLAGAATGGSYLAVSLDNQEIDISGDAGDDSIAISMSATATGGSLAEIDDFAFEARINGGAGNDNIAIDLSAFASGTYAAIGHESQEETGFFGNEPLFGGPEAYVYGGSGADTISFNADYRVAAQSGGASQINFNGRDDVWLEGGQGQDTLSININMQATGSATYAFIEASRDLLFLSGGDSDDSLSIQYNAADQFGLRAEVYGGLGTDDIDISFTGDDADGNVVTVFAGSGDDLVDIAFNSFTVTDSIRMFFHGGKGADTVNLDHTVSGSGLQTADLLYATTGELGDVYNGFTASDNINFVFDADHFEGESLTSADRFVVGTAAQDSNDHFIYDDSINALFYDADGTGSAAAIEVARFDTDVDLTAGDITFTSSFGGAVITATSGSQSNYYAYQEGGTGDDTIAFNAVFSDTNFTAFGTLHVSDYYIQNGGDGNDSLAVMQDLNRTNLATFTSAYGYAGVYQDGAAGDDTISASVDIDMTGSTSGDLFGSGWVYIGDMYGGSGSDSINASAAVLADNVNPTFGSAYAWAFVSSVDAFGEAGDDSISLAVTANAQAEGYVSAWASAYGNNLDGGTGNDTISIDLAGSAINSSSSFAYGYGGYGARIHGGEGADAINLDASIRVTNSSGYAYGSLDNELVITGGDGADAIDIDDSVNVHGAFSGASAYVFVDHEMFLGDGDDAVTMNSIATASATSGYVLGSVNGSVDIYAGSGNDTISISVTGSASGGTTASGFAVLEGNIHGDKGNDAISLSFVARGVGDYGAGNVTSHDLDLAGGAGDDTISIDNTAFGSGTGSFSGVGYYTANQLDVRGGGGNDAITFGALVSANAFGSSNNAYAYANGNDLAFGGGFGSDSIDVDLTASASGTRVASAYATNNEVLLSGGTGNDTLNFDVLVQAGGSASSVFAKYSGNTIAAYGGVGDDSLAINVTANAVATASGIANAQISDNEFTLSGGGGDDSISLILSASTYGASGSQYVSSNEIDVQGGDGNDTINLTMSADEIRSNFFEIEAGAGQDVISFLFNGDSPSTSWVTFIYRSTDALGDEINGAGAISNIFLSFDSSVFNGSTSTGALSSDNFQSGTDVLAGLTDSDDFWFYDTDDFVLYYDEDGTGSATAQIVATFTSNVSLDNGNILLFNDTQLEG